MRVVVDRNLKGDTTLKSEILSGIFGKQKFKVIDTAKNEITSADPEVPKTALYEVAVFDASKGPYGVQFKTVWEKDLKHDLAKPFASDNQPFEYDISRQDCLHCGGWCRGA